MNNFSSLMVWATEPVTDVFYFLPTEGGPVLTAIVQQFVPPYVGLNTAVTAKNANAMPSGIKLEPISYEIQIRNV